MTIARRAERRALSSAFFARPRCYLERNYRIELRAIIVRELVGKVHNSRILDLGCGNGQISVCFLGDGNAVTLVDSSAAMLTEARAVYSNAIRSEVIFCQGDLLNFNGNESFDLVLCLGVLSHVDSTEKTLAVIARALKPGGRCVVQLSDSATILTRIFLYHQSLRLIFCRLALRYRATRIEEVIDAGRRTGLVPVVYQRHLLLLPGLSRLLGTKLVAFDRFVRNRPWLADRAMDAIMMFKKHDSFA